MRTKAAGACLARLIRVCRRRTDPDLTTDDLALPEERTFNRVLGGVVTAVGAFGLAFLIATAVKATRSSHDITSNWFVAWGTWAGGLGTSAAFLIAASSISVASAHARLDRRQSAQLREDDEMAQARLLSIYKVEDENSVSTLPTYRIENRSKDLFFDVTVPYVDAPYVEGEGLERRTADKVARDNRLHEFIPTGEELTPYRENTDHEAWFTLVTVHTIDASRIRFAVDYTDASGRRWSQALGGRIVRVPTTDAVAVRPPDRFQPPQQIRKMTDLELWRSGGMFTKGLAPLETDEQFLEVIEVRNVRNWKRIERVGDVEIRPNDFDIPPEGLIAVVTFQPAAPPFWADYFFEELASAGLSSGSGSRQHTQTEKFRLSPDANTDADHVTELIDTALDHANRAFEQNELAAARRALQARSGNGGEVYRGPSSTR